MVSSFVQTPRTIRDGETGRSVRVESRARNVLRNRGTFLRTNDRLDVREITQAVATTLSNVTAKELADATGGSIRAAQNVREGLNAMSLAGFLNACRSIPELRALAMEMMGCEAETDPEFVKGISLLMNSYARKAQASAEGEANASTSHPERPSHRRFFCAHQAIYNSRTR